MLQFEFEFRSGLKKILSEYSSQKLKNHKDKAEWRKAFADSCRFGEFSWYCVDVAWLDCSLSHLTDS